MLRRLLDAVDRGELTADTPAERRNLRRLEGRIPAGQQLVRKPDGVADGRQFESGPARDLRRYESFAAPSWTLNQADLARIQRPPSLLLGAVFRMDRL